MAQNDQLEWMNKTGFKVEKQVKYLRVTVMDKTVGKSWDVLLLQ